MFFIFMYFNKWKHLKILKNGFDCIRKALFIPNIFKCLYFPLFFLILVNIKKKWVQALIEFPLNDHLNAPVEINAILNFLNVYKGSLFHGTPFSMLEMIRILFTNFSLQGKNIETKWAATKSYYKMCFFLKPTILWWRIQIWLYKKTFLLNINIKICLGKNF